MTQLFRKHWMIKVLIGLSIVLSAICIARGGYHFGQWLHRIMH